MNLCVYTLTKRVFFSSLILYLFCFYFTQNGSMTVVLGLTAKDNVENIKFTYPFKSTLVRRQLMDRVNHQCSKSTPRTRAKRNSHVEAGSLGNRLIFGKNTT